MYACIQYIQSFFQQHLTRGEIRINISWENGIGGFLQKVEEGGDSRGLSILSSPSKKNVPNINPFICARKCLCILYQRERKKFDWRDLGPFVGVLFRLYLPWFEWRRLRKKGTKKDAFWGTLVGGIGYGQNCKKRSDYPSFYLAQYIVIKKIDIPFIYRVWKGGREPSFFSKCQKNRAANRKGK